MIDSKNVTEYMLSSTPDLQGHLCHQDFSQHPGTAFLQFTVSAKDAIELCKESFPKYGNNHLVLDSTIKIQTVINSILASIMGNFETYQKHLFAGTFEKSVYFEEFNSTKFFRDLTSAQKRSNDNTQISIPILELLGYRSETAQTGMLLANSLSKWQSSETVNKYFKAFGFNQELFSNEDKEDLAVLWQIRHSIAHTASTITCADSQKNDLLKSYSGKTVVFSNKFIYKLTKRLHSLVYNANLRMQNEVAAKLKPSLTELEKDEILLFYQVSSISNPSWLC